MITNVYNQINIRWMEMMGYEYSMIIIYIIYGIYINTISKLKDSILLLFILTSKLRWIIKTTNKRRTNITKIYMIYIT